MATSHGSNADVVANGWVLSEFLNVAGFSGSRDTGDTTTFKKKSRHYIPGLKDASMGVEGIFDGELNASDEILNAALNSVSDIVVSYIPQGQETFGNIAYSLVSITTTYEVNTDVGDVAQNSAEFSAGKGGGIERGKVAHPLAARSTTGNGTTIDNATATADGGSLVVHTTTAVAGATVALQDSADGVAWADVPGTVITLAAGRSSLRAGFTGAFRRYTRVRWSGTATFLAVINRN